MTQQAKMVVSRPSPGGTTTIRVPRKIGMGHGDIVSAWVLAVHRLAYSHVSENRPVFEPGSEEWITESNRRLRAHQDKQQFAYLKNLEKQVKGTMNAKRYRQMFQDRY